MKEVDMEKDVRMLHEKGVVSLEQWRDYEGKDTVSPLVKGTLDAALSRVQTSTSVVKSTVLKGYYESVYNARWHHVVEVPDGEGTGLEVREGNRNSHGRTGQLAAPSKRITVCSSPVQSVSG
ncbi:retrotransposon hot spot (RHS) protein [Trypanosoma cruzi]|nr:retrotransposon hot spot (RHS) protein [Trypanosoma cruzi]